MAHVANLTIDGTTPSATHTNYPKLIRGSDFPAGVWSTATASGGDIRIFLSDGATEVAREVVSFDNVAEEAEIWALIPTLTAGLSGTDDTVLQIHADGVSSDYAHSGTPFGGAAVWVDLEFASHDGGATDSSENHTLTASGGVATGAVGQIGEASSFDGNGDYYETSANLGITGSQNRTLSAWLKTSSSSDQIVFDFGSTSGGNPMYRFRIDETASGVWSLATETAAASRKATTDVATGAWIYGVSVLEGTNWSDISHYVNGALDSAFSTSGGTVGTIDGVLRVSGSQFSNNRYWNGDLDELRIRADALSADWITDEYADQSGNAAWHTITAVGGGGSTLVVQDLSHSHTIDNLVLTQANTLALQDVSHAQTLDGVVLTASGQIAPNDLAHSHTVEAVTITPSGSLAVDGVDHSQTIDNVALTVQGALSVADMAHNHTLDNVALTQAHILTLNSITHAHVIDALSVSPGFGLTVNDLAHSQTIEGVSITVSGDVLTVNGLTHVHLTENIDLTQAGVLSVQGLTHAQLLDLVTLAGIAIGELNGEIYMYAAIDGEVVMKPILTATIH